MGRNDNYWKNDYWKPPSSDWKDTGRNKTGKTDGGNKKTWNPNEKPAYGEWCTVNSELKPRCVVCKVEGNSCMHDFRECPRWIFLQKEWVKNHPESGGERKGGDNTKGGKGKGQSWQKRWY